MQSGVIELEAGLRLVRAANASPMTYTGTNTYIVGTGTVAVIDPGPADPLHLREIFSALEHGETVSHIFVTHSHRDHSPLARMLAEETGAPVLAFGTHEDGRSPVMQRLAAAGLAGGGEGIDEAFQPDIRLADGDVVQGGDWALEALWTPGHIANHLCFAWGDAVFTGDHVMGWASSLVSPPDGDLTAFMASCRKLTTRSDRVFYPGHGEPVSDPAGRLTWLIAHRETREAEILSGLSDGPKPIPQLARAIYTDVEPALLPAAQRNVFAHLIDLNQRGLVSAEPSLGWTATFALL